MLPGHMGQFSFETQSTLAGDCSPTEPSNVRVRQLFRTCCRFLSWRLGILEASLLRPGADSHHITDDRRLARTVFGIWLGFSLSPMRVSSVARLAIRSVQRAIISRHSALRFGFDTCSRQPRLLAQQRSCSGIFDRTWNRISRRELVNCVDSACRRVIDCTGIRRSCRFLDGMLRALTDLPGGIGRFLPCTIGGNHCRLRHIEREQSGHGLSSRPRKSADHLFLHVTMLAKIITDFCCSFFLKKKFFRMS